MKLFFLLIIISITVSQFLSVSDIHSQEITNEAVGSISAITAISESTGHSPIGLEKSKENQVEIIESTTWKATNYIAGDIVKSTYIVQLGDTLWEIAEAYLEDGIYWTIILGKNINQIGFLPDGTQALIQPGQILNL